MKKLLIPFLAFIITNNLWAERIRTLSCNDKNEKNLISLLGYVNDNWGSVEKLWEQEGGRGYPRCLKRRLIRNGVVVCHRRNFVGPEYHRCVGTNGWANVGGIRAHVCPSFFDQTEKMEYHNQRACYAGLLFRLYGKNCYKRSRFPKSYMTLVEFGFKWYAQNNPVTTQFRDCSFE